MQATDIQISIPDTPEEMTMESVDIGIQVENQIIEVNGEKVMVGVKCNEFK